MNFEKSSLINFILGILIGGVILLILLMGAVPPVSRDALTHHLYVPKLYLRHGGIFEIPHIEFSYFPMNLDLLYMAALYFKNDILPKFIHFFFAVATAWMIFSYLKHRINTTYALLGSLFFLSIPVIVYQSTVVYVDLGVVCFLFASMIYLFRWIEGAFNMIPLLISAVFCGLALGTKYNGLVGFFLLGLFIPLVYTRYHPNSTTRTRKAVSFSLFYIFIALTIFSPWMIRNALWTGNPVYPLYNTLFNPDDQKFEIPGDEDSGIVPRMSHFLIRKQLYKESGWEIALIPLRVFFQGQDDNPKYFDGRANPFLLLLPVFAFLGIRSDSRQIQTEKFLMLGFSALFLLFACAQTVIRIRYFAPIFPPLVILSMFGLKRINQCPFYRSGKIVLSLNKLMLYSLVVIMLGWNTKYIIKRFMYVQPLDYLAGKISRDDYIQRYRPEYASMQYANRNLTAQDRILGVYLGNRGYYSNIDIIFSIELLRNLAAKAESCMDISAALHERGISYLLVNYELFNFWVKEYTLYEKKMLKDFFTNNTVTEFTKDKHGLLRVKP